MLFGFVAELGLIETTQSLGERTQSILEVLRIGIYARDLAEILSRGSTFAHRRILVEFEAVSQLFSFSLCVEPWRLA